MADTLLSVTVIVCTNGLRLAKLKTCIDSVRRNDYGNFSVFVVDQSKFPLNNLKVSKHIYAAKKGLSHAKNIGIKHARSDIIAFTDDDCVVSKTWIRGIVRTFSRSPELDAVLGKVLPYQKKHHRAGHCPAIVIAPAPAVIHTVSRLFQLKGSGNNMAIRRRVLEDMNGFKEWLGPGSVGKSAEDMELLVRMIIAKKNIYYSPRAVLYHNNWLARWEYEHRMNTYRYGDMACFVYYLLLGHRFAKERILYNLSIVWGHFRRLVKYILTRPSEGVYMTPLYFEEIFYVLYGAAVGFVKFYHP